MKERLDKILVMKKLADTRSLARAFIMEGLVYVNGEKIIKAGTNIEVTSEVKVKKKQFMPAGEVIS